jgi:hypothetical protein
VREKERDADKSGLSVEASDACPSRSRFVLCAPCMICNPLAGVCVGRAN